MRHLAHRSRRRPMRCPHRRHRRYNPPRRIHPTHAEGLPMTPDRFRTIVDAYGADARHWPADERAAALAWADTHQDEAHALLAASAQLDAWLPPAEPPHPAH